MKKKCTFKGTEPSPKGKGYCARNLKVGKRMKGKDGNMWVVKKTKRGQRWFKIKNKKKLTKSVSPDSRNKSKNKKKLTKNKKNNTKKLLNKYYNEMNDFPNPIALKLK